MNTTTVSQYSARRSDYDVTNTVRVSSAADVRDAVQALFEQTWPGTPFSPIARAFHDFEMAFTGRMPGYFGVDTVYHDQQHTLDVTLAMARLMAGYEHSHTGTPLALIAEHVKDPRDIKLGHLFGTADMIAQMADRCYLEKCRDRLYPEFVLGGVAVAAGARGDQGVRYASGLDLLRQTPGFMEETRLKRLNAAFDHAYRHVEPLFGGRNPYMESIDRSLAFLRQVLRSESWRMLRRSSQVFAAEPDSLTSVRGLMASYFKRAWSRES